MIDTQPREIIHVYYEREEERRPAVLLPLFFALLCLLGIAAVTFYSWEHPTYEHQRLTVPVQLLPPKVFTAQAPIIPTGIKTYPATTAHGVLTITNGSIIAQVIPAGFTIGNVATDASVYIPPGNADGYGYATVRAHALISGKNGNILTLAVNQVIGSSVYIRNLRPFTGGRDAYSVKFVTPADKHTALLRAQGILLSKSSGLHYPCKEDRFLLASIKITWRCTFVSYHLPSYMHATAVRLSGKYLVIDVWFLPRPTHIWVK